MSTDDMTTLLKQLSGVFFCSVILLDHAGPQGVYEWILACKSDYGDASAEGNLPRIRLHPTAMRLEMYLGHNALMYQRIVTLIHELSYALFSMYACQEGLTGRSKSASAATERHGKR